jgi:hypothetical protein
MFFRRFAVKPQKSTQTSWRRWEKRIPSYIFVAEISRKSLYYLRMAIFTAMPTTGDA